MVDVAGGGPGESFSSLSVVNSSSVGDPVVPAPAVMPTYQVSLLRSLTCEETFELTTF